MPGDEFLPKQRVAYLAHMKHQTLEYFLGQSIVEFFDKRAYCADCMRTAADLHFRLRQRRAPIGIEPHGVMECLPQLVRYGIRRQRSRRFVSPTLAHFTATAFAARSDRRFGTRIEEMQTLRPQREAQLVAAFSAYIRFDCRNHSLFANLQVEQNLGA